MGRAEIEGKTSSLARTTVKYRNVEQLDGSIHDWFEERGPRCVLILHIDDAMSNLMYGKFVDRESTENLLLTTKKYLLLHGRLMAFYVDKDSIKTERVLGNDWTVRFRNELYQVTAEQPVNIRPKDRIMVEIRLDGTIHLYAKGRYLVYKKIKARRYRPHYERMLDNKYYAPKQGSLSYARQVQISI